MIVMKLALVNLDRKSFDPPFGLAYIASYLRKYGGFNDIIIVDKEEPMKKLDMFMPDIVAVTSMSYEFHEANRFAGKIKERFGKGIPIIIGGQHISFMPNHLKYSNFDIGVMGEGEQTMLELVQLYERKREFLSEDLTKIDGIVFGNNHITVKRKQIQNLDSIPFPARDLLNMKNYYLFPRRSMSLDHFGIYAHMFTSRGCPYNCTYCGGKKLWETTRFHSAEYVMSEIEELDKNYKIDGIIVWDDLFIANKERVKKISELIKEKGLDRLEFSVNGRANLIDERMCGYLKDMNVKKISFGLESGSERILKSIKKNTVTVEQNRSALAMCKKFGFLTAGYFMIGCPDETEDDIMLTKELIENKDIDIGVLFQMTPLPGTEVWEYAKQKGFVTDDFSFDISKMKLGMKDNMLLTDKITDERFKELFELLSSDMSKKYSHKTPILKLEYLKYIFLPSVMRRLPEIIKTVPKTILK